MSDEVTLTGVIQMHAANRTGGDVGRQVIPQYHRLVSLGGG